MEKIRIWTDGSCNPNPGRGGWAFALNKKEFKSGFVEETTNNRMEMLAIVEALAYCNHEFPMSEVVVMSDSKYCVNGFNIWMHNWKKNGWTKKGGEIKNLDLWKQMFSLRHNCKLKWVRGHNGDVMNEFVDALASGDDLRVELSNGDALEGEINKESYNHLIGVFQKHTQIKLSKEAKTDIMEEIKRRFFVKLVNS